MCYTKTFHITKAAPIKPIHCVVPMELNSMDFFYLDQYSGGLLSTFLLLLIIVQNFSKHSPLAATDKTDKSSKLTKVATGKFYNNFILHFGIRDNILRYQRREFEKDLLKHLLKCCSIPQFWSSPYHPQGIDQCESMNRIIINMSKKLGKENKSSRKNHLRKLV